MPVPNSSIPTPHRLLRFGLACLFLLASTTALARGPEPSLRLPLDKFGFMPVSPQYLLDGSSMLTLHYIDDKHLLLTFVARRLIKRLPDEPEDDQDRNVDAVLIELPSGEILARTTWHFHDHSQYLWNLGHGHFLLRIRDTLTTFAPLANLSSIEPFAQHPFLVSKERRLAALLLSPDADLLIIESIKRTPPAPRPKTPILGPAPVPAPSPQLMERNPVQINFYRIHTLDDGGPVQAAFAGAVEARKLGDIPASTAGYLAVVDQGQKHYAFDFHSYAGKTAELSPFDSNCPPAPLFVSHSEFIAFGCRTGQTMQQIGGFNLRGEEMWEQGLFGDFVAPSVAFAPVSGRFALSRIMLRTSAIADQPISADEVVSQTVVVYQTGTGKQLLRVDCSPVERAGQNFTLSPNGLALAAVHADAIEIYNLPPLSTKDQADVKLARSIAPPENDLPVRLNGRATAGSSTDSEPSNEPSPQPQAVAPASTAATNTPVDSTPPPAAATPAAATPAPTPSGDAAPEQHRAPPTIYTLPGDKAPATPKDTPQ